MDIVEYLLFVPLLIYGIALSDLFSQWKRFIEPSFWYLPYQITLVLVTEVGVYNVFEFFKLASHFSSISYFVYWLYLLPPLLFLLMVNFLTHSEDFLDMASFFSSRRKPVFLLQFHFNLRGWPVQVLAILFSFTYAFWPKKAIFYVLVAVWFLSIVVRAYLISANT